MSSSSPIPNIQQFPFQNVQQQQQIPFLQRPPPTWQQQGNQQYYPQQPPQMNNPYYAQHMMHPQPNLNPYVPPPGASTAHAQYSYHIGGMVPPQQQPPQYHHHPMMPFPAGGLMRPVTAIPKQPQVPTPPTSGNIAGAYVPSTTVPAASLPPPRQKKIPLITVRFINSCLHNFVHYAFICFLLADSFLSLSSPLFYSRTSMVIL
jgi:hypothetical protein